MKTTSGEIPTVPADLTIKNGLIRSKRVQAQAPPRKPNQPETPTDVSTRSPAPPTTLLCHVAWPPLLTVLSASRRPPAREGRPSAAAAGLSS